MVDFEEDLPEMAEDDFDPEDEFDVDKEAKRVFDKYEPGHRFSSEVPVVRLCNLGP